MNCSGSVLRNDEKAIFALRSIYERFGYSHFKMSKFEEYDLYVRNKDFLVSDGVITFTDTNGKLMALKPDVTLSIIKNTNDGEPGAHKVYYDENVYRVSKGTHSFKEIMQVGLECIGDIDGYAVSEVLMLAVKSLETISENCVLDISHLGIVSDVIEGLGITGDYRGKLLKCIGEKNVHEIAAVCKEAGADDTRTELLKQLVMTYGKPTEVLGKLTAMLGQFNPSLTELAELTETLSMQGLEERIRIDFSVINDMSYYNGIVFKGFIDGIPAGVLSGGQYDKLMRKMGRKSGAIGFAVYLDMLEHFGDGGERFDVDSVLIYEKGADIRTVAAAVKSISDSGVSVMAQPTVPENIKCRKLLKLCGSEVTEYGNA